MKLRRSKHEWGLWSRPQERYSHDAIQIRICQKCGIAETRKVKETSVMGVNQVLETEIPDAALQDLNANR